MSWDDPGKTWQYAFDKAEMATRREASRTFVLPPCGLKFIDDHFGPRPGCLHSLLGSIGRGKSTLVQGLVLEWGKNAAMLLYLSEEGVDRVEAKLFEKNPEAGYLTTKLHVVHETDVLKQVDANNYRGFLSLLRSKLDASKAEILIIDNITTSQFYEGKFNNVMGLLSGLREIATDFNIPIFLVCHTKKGVNETSRGLIMPDDVRGSATLPMTCDYFYTFSRYRFTTEFGATRDSAFVVVNKCRDHDTQDTVYRLEYEAHRKRYVSDSAVSFKVLKEVQKLRDRA